MLGKRREEQGEFQGLLVPLGVGLLLYPLRQLHYLIRWGAGCEVAGEVNTVAGSN